MVGKKVVLKNAKLGHFHKWSQVFFIFFLCYFANVKHLMHYPLGLGNKYRFLDTNRFSFLQTDIDS